MIRLRIMYVLLSVGLVVFGASGVLTGLRYRSAQTITYANFTQQRPAGWFKINGAAYDLSEAAPYEKDKQIEALYVPLRAVDELGLDEENAPVRTFLVIRNSRDRATIDFYKSMRPIMDSRDSKKIVEFLYKNKNRIYHRGVVSGMTSQSIDLDGSLAENSELRREFPAMVADVGFLENEKTPTLAGPAAMLAAGLALCALGIRSVRSKVGKNKATNVPLPINVPSGASISDVPNKTFPTTSPTSTAPTLNAPTSSSPPDSPWN